MPMQSPALWQDCQRVCDMHALWLSNPRFRHDVQGHAGKFMLNGEEIDLGVGPQASMAHRVEALRVLLEQRLGFDVFMK